MQPDTPAVPTRSADEPIGRRIARNRHRQRELYGDPLAARVRHLVDLLGITQARLARTLGMSPAMLSQLVSGRRVKIGDPAALARFQMIDHRCSGLAEPPTAEAVDRLLVEVSRARWRWLGADPAGPVPGSRTGSSPRAPLGVPVGGAAPGLPTRAAGGGGRGARSRVPRAGRGAPAGRRPSLSRPRGRGPGHQRCW